MKLDLDLGTMTAWLSTAALLGCLLLLVSVALREKGKGIPEFLTVGVFALVGLLALFLTLGKTAPTYLLVPYVMVVAIAWIEQMMLGHPGFFAKLFYGAVVLSVLAFISSQLWAAVQTENGVLAAVTEGLKTVKQTTEPGADVGPPARTGAPATQAPAELPPVPIRVTELARGKAWRFDLAGPTDAQSAAAHVRAASPQTARLRGGKTYRFRAPGIPRGTVHVTTQYTGGTGNLAKDAVVPGNELPYGLTKIFPKYDMTTTVWQEGTAAGPIEIVIEETGESHHTAMARIGRMVDSQPVP